VSTVKLPETDLARIARYCADRVPAPVRKEVQVEFETRGRAVTIVETRPPWRDRNERWFDYDHLFSGTAAELLAEIDADPTCIFWG